MTCTRPHLVVGPFLRAGDVGSVPAGGGSDGRDLEFFGRFTKFAHKYLGGDSPCAKRNSHRPERSGSTD
jgi:hypothetical protein